VRAAPSPPGAPAAQSPLTSVHADAPAPRRHAAAASLDCCMAASAPAAHPFLSHAWHERGQAARLAGGLSGAGADSGPHLGGTRAERVRSSGRRRPSARRMSSLTLPWRASAQPQTPHGENVLQRARHEERKSGSFARIAASGATCAAAPVRASAALLRARRHAGLEAQRAERLEDLDERPGAERAQQPALQGPQQRHGAVLGLGCGKVCVAYRGLARRSADLAERETCEGAGHRLSCRGCQHSACTPRFTWCTRAGRTSGVLRVQQPVGQLVRAGRHTCGIEPAPHKVLAHATKARQSVIHSVLCTQQQAHSAAQEQRSAANKAIIRHIAVTHRLR